MTKWLWLLWLTLGWFAGCADEPTGMPSVVAQSWEIRLRGTGDSVEAATSIDLSQVDHFQLHEPWNLPYPLPAEFYGRFEPPNTPIVWIGGYQRSELPPAPTTFDELGEHGLSISAVTYCGFVNPDGQPRDADADTVERAMSAFFDAVREPFQAAGLVDEELEVAGKVALEELSARVLAEYDRRGVADPYSESAFVRVLASKPLGYLSDLVDFIPDLVWTLGDARTRNTLVGCSSVLLFDVPYLIVNNNFPQRFNGYCGFGSTGTRTCALESLHGYGDRVMFGLLPPLDRRFASWSITIDLDFDELGPE